MTTPIPQQADGSAIGWNPPPRGGDSSDLIGAAFRANRYAGIGLRFAAAIVDGVIVGVAQYIVGWVLGMGLGRVFASSHTEPFTDSELTGLFSLLQLLGYVVALSVAWAYFALMESSPKQATIGKIAFGLAVTGDDGARLSLARATGRYFGKILSGLILLVGYLMIAFTPRRQGLHDQLARTVVLRVR